VWQEQRRVRHNNFCLLSSQCYAFLSVFHNTYFAYLYILISHICVFLSVAFFHNYLVFMKFIICSKICVCMNCVTFFMGFLNPNLVVLRRLFILPYALRMKKTSSSKNLVSVWKITLHVVPEEVYLLTNIKFSQYLIKFTVQIINN